jgi:hypothetical protein
MKEFEEERTHRSSVFSSSFNERRDTFSPSEEADLRRLARGIHENCQQVPLEKIEGLIKSVEALEQGWVQGNEGPYFQALSQNPQQRLKAVALLSNFIQAYELLDLEAKNNKDKRPERTLKHHQRKLQLMEKEKQQAENLRKFNKDINSLEKDITVLEEKLSYASHVYEGEVKRQEEVKRENEKKQLMGQKDRSEWKAHPGVQRDEQEGEVRSKLRFLGTSGKESKLKELIKKGFSSPEAIWGLGRVIRDLPPESQFVVLQELFKGISPHHPYKEAILQVIDTLLPGLNISRQRDLLKTIGTSDIGKGDRRFLDRAQSLFYGFPEVEGDLIGDPFAAQLMKSSYNPSSLAEEKAKQDFIHQVSQGNLNKKAFVKSFLLLMPQLESSLLDVVAHEILTFSPTDQEELWHIFMDRHLATSEAWEKVRQGIFLLPLKEQTATLVKLLNKQTDFYKRSVLLNQAILWLDYKGQQRLIAELNRGGLGNLLSLVQGEVTPAEPPLRNSTPFFENRGQEEPYALRQFKRELGEVKERREMLLREKRSAESQIQALASQIRELEINFTKTQAHESAKEILLHKAMPLLNKAYFAYGNFFQWADPAISRYALEWCETLAQVGINNRQEFDLLYKAWGQFPGESRKKLWNALASNPNPLVITKGLAAALDLIPFSQEEAHGALSFLVEKNPTHKDVIHGVVALSYQEPHLELSRLLLNKLFHLVPGNEDFIAATFQVAGKASLDNPVFGVLPEMIHANPQKESVVQGILSLLPKAPELLTVLVGKNPTHRDVVRVALKEVTENPHHKKATDMVLFLIPHNSQKQSFISSVLELLRQEARWDGDKVSLFTQLRQVNPFSLSVVREGRELAARMKDEAGKLAIEKALGEYKTVGWLGWIFGQWGESWYLNKP